MRHRPSHILLSGAVTTALLLASACGGDDADTSAAGSDTTEAPAESSETTGTTQVAPGSEFESDTLDLPLDPSPGADPGTSIGRLEFVPGSGSMGDANGEGVVKPCAYFVFDGDERLAVAFEGYDLTLAPGGQPEGTATQISIWSNAEVDADGVPLDLAQAFLRDESVEQRTGDSASDRVAVVHDGVAPVSDTVADYCIGEVDQAVIITGIEPAP